MHVAPWRVSRPVRGAEISAAGMLRARERIAAPRREASHLIIILGCINDQRVAGASQCDRCVGRVCVRTQVTGVVRAQHQKSPPHRESLCEYDLGAMTLGVYVCM